jgi:GNAT superfamily N-acetyltransferase
MELRQVRPSDPEVAPLLAPVIDGLAAEYLARYGEIDEMSSVSMTEFDPPDGTFVVVVDGGTVVAGGGLRRLSATTCEVKRMWTDAAHRRKGCATLVLHTLEEAGRAAGYDELWLETGPEQPEAFAFYTALGYRRIPFYGRYDRALAFALDL